MLLTLDVLQHLCGVHHAAFCCTDSRQLISLMLFGCQIELAYSRTDSLILVIRPRSWVSHEQPHLKPCCSGAMMMLFYCMMVLMTICENLALVADDTCEGNWLELF